MNNTIAVVLVSLLGFVSFSCNEPLPEYAPPDEVLSASVSSAEQLSDRIGPPGNQLMRIQFTVENVYDEVFFDSVDIAGTMTIWWFRKPGRKRTFTLNEKNFSNRNLIVNRKMMLLPGQKVELHYIWDFKGDDSTYFPAEMMYARARLHACGSYRENTIICSNEEEMYIEGTLTLFKNFEQVNVKPMYFTCIGRLEYD